MSQQPPLIFCVGVLYNNIIISAIFKEFHRSKLKICRLNNAFFENITKFQRYYYHGNSKQLNISINILYLQYFCCS